jgi:lipid A disaccharide synthetase
MNQPIDILILSNGPGELSTWVKPVLRELRQQLGENRDQVRVSIVLSPDTNASGQEVAIARRYPECDRIQAAEHFFPFLVFGKTQENWDWRSRGLVIFLGGDQFFPVIIGKRLGYRTLVYAEWEARWHSLIDRFAVMKPEIAERVAANHAHKFTVVGDLMAEAGTQLDSQDSSLQPPAHPLVGLMPGSKPMKLSLGVPLMLAIADQIHQTHPHIRFGIPVAPTLDLAALAAYAQRDRNPVIDTLGWMTGELVLKAGSSEPKAAGEETDGERAFLKTPSGAELMLWTEFPAYQRLAQCQLCLTTIGANTAELGALGVPMLVLIPTQQLDAMRAWDGIPGLLVNLPGVGATFARLINGFVARRVGLLAWPNIWAQREIVPELIGELQPAALAAQVIDYLSTPAKLEQMRQELQAARGKPGAAKKMVELAIAELENGQMQQEDE